MECPCGSKIPYLSCCGRFHRGKLAPTALELMRSRYAAYAVKNADYILRTTHPEHPDCSIPLPKRRKTIQAFCNSTRFIGLEILAVEEKETLATVTFRALLKQEGKDVSFTEKSLFEKIEGQWFYKSSLES